VLSQLWSQQVSKKSTVAVVMPVANERLANEAASAWTCLGYTFIALQDAKAGYFDISPYFRECPNRHGVMMRYPSASVFVLRVEKYLGYYRSCYQMMLSAWAGNPGLRYVVAAGEDMTPDPHINPEDIADQLDAHFGPERYGVMQPTGDDLRGTDQICGSPWIGHGWFLRGYRGIAPWHLGYRHFFGDEELRIVAKREGVLLDRPDLTQRHNHWSRPDSPTGGQRSEFGSRLADWAWDHDREMFERRRALSFPACSVD
jgi:hypothetical protein